MKQKDKNCTAAPHLIPMRARLPSRDGGSEQDRAPATPISLNQHTRRGQQRGAGELGDNAATPVASKPPEPSSPQPARMLAFVPKPYVMFRPRRRCPAPSIKGRAQKQVRIIDLLATRPSSDRLLDLMLQMIDPMDKQRGLIETVASGDVPSVVMDRIIDLLEQCPSDSFPVVRRYEEVPQVVEIVHRRLELHPPASRVPANPYEPARKELENMGGAGCNPRKRRPRTGPPTKSAVRQED